jgi:hypothetical protein
MAWTLCGSLSYRGAGTRRGCACGTRSLAVSCAITAMYSRPHGKTAPCAQRMPTDDADDLQAATDHPCHAIAANSIC